MTNTCLAEGHLGLQITNITQSPGNPVTLGNSVAYTLTIQNTVTQISTPAIIQITSTEDGIIGPFSSTTEECSLFEDDSGTTFCPTVETGQTQYTFNWQPPEGQHNLTFTVICAADCVGQDSQFITTNVIQTSPTVDQLKTISGNLQRGTPGTTLSPFVINAFDATENPVEGVSVDWEIMPASGGTLPQLTTTTDASGQSSNTLSLNTSDRVEVIATVRALDVNSDSVIAKNLHDPVSVVFVVNGGIADRPGLTKNQKSVAKAVDTMCVALAEMGEGRSAEQDDMLATCGRLGTGDLTDVAANLDLLAHEEVSTQGRVILETAKLQSASIHRRLVALRAGTRGINLSGLNIRIDGQTLPESIVTALFGGNTQGGSAGEQQGIASRWGSFVNATVIVGDRDKTGQETGFNFRAEGITAGADYRISDKLVVGGALGYSGKDSDFKENAGNLDINNWHLTAYGSYYRSASFYLDGLIRLGKNNIDTRRRINLPGDPLQEGVGDTTGLEYAISLSGGYEYSRNALTFGPYGRLGYIRTSINGYTESASNPGGLGSGSVLTIDNQDVDSITAVLGSQASYAISARNAVYLLQLNGEWEHEFRDNSRAIAAQFAYDPTRTSFDIDSDSPDRNYFNLGLGVTAVFANGRSGFLHYESRLGQDNVRQYWINGGIRIEL
ncbi:MAG: autotransporter domain-containing protein [Gammaproteobacteria bacterium]|nr:autotransporter domain-containing protein [Gammaproteobacteria bacterium]